MNKQIERMAQVYEEARYKAQETLGSMNEGAGIWYAKAFYNAGYRRQDEVAREIFAEIEKLLYRKCFLVRADRDVTGLIIDGELFAELKKKYEVQEDEQ